jgi:hypothetical protein
MELREYFDKLSGHARWRERRGEVREAQDIRDIRNHGWKNGTETEVRHQQMHAPTRSWR